MKVLLAEDHKIVRQGTRLYLESVGVEVIGEATNGREAIELAGRLQPDVILMDIHLPELTGVEATRRIRHEYPDIRILVLTAYNEPAYVHALLDAGAPRFHIDCIERGTQLRISRRDFHEVAAMHPANVGVIVEIDGARIVT